MTPNTKVQFVTFETSLSAEPFLRRWKEYKRSVKSDADVTLQQSIHNGTFRYIAQHRFANEDNQFVFTKGRGTTGVPQEAIKSSKAGGYTLLQAGMLTDPGPNEVKVFAFLTDPRTDLTVYKDASESGKLNIYEPYYLSCKFAYILEYFANKKNADLLVEQLKNLECTDVAVFTECNIPKSLKVPEKQEEAYVW